MVRGNSGSNDKLWGLSLKITGIRAKEKEVSGEYKSGTIFKKSSCV